MKTLASLIALVGGGPLAGDEDGPARRVQLAAAAAGSAAGLCALYGLAVGVHEPSLLLGNLYKVPMVVLLSAAAALPVGLLTWKLVNSAQSALDLVLGTASGVLTGGLVLAVLAPLVAVYYATSSWLGPVVALGAAGVATCVGLAVMARAVVQRRPEGSPLALATAPVGAMALVQLAMLLQLIAVASPILPEITVFDGGMDRLLSHVSDAPSALVAR